MITVDALIESPQFSFDDAQRESLLLPVVRELVEFHSLTSPEYQAVLNSGGLPNPETEGFASLPYLPVRAFKELDLASVPRESIVKILTSSGTTGQAVSRINLDAENATRQQKALSSVMTTVLGPNRLPMLIVDTPTIIRSRDSYSARGAGVVGMMTFGRDHHWVLNEDMSLDREALDRFLAKHGAHPFLIFGFTFMVWQYLLKTVAPGEIDLRNGVLIHSGGWKKLESESVDNDTFKREWRERTGLGVSRNFYGMVEQIGSTFVEGDDGWLYCPNFAEVVIRNPENWSVAAPGTPGVIEVISALPTSYPGHVLLTEDLGVASEPMQEGDWRGTRFKVLGRLPKAELRGCSDTHAQNAS